MFLWFIRILVILSGPAIGYWRIDHSAKGIVVGFLVALAVIAIEILIERVPLDSLIAGGLGAILGLIAAKLLDYSVAQLDNGTIERFAQDYSLIIKIVFAYLGFVIAIRKKEEISLLDQDIRFTSRRRPEEVKVLDTSSLIDGRIADICDTKFISGTLVVPSFILRELQAIADSSDSVKRVRGRRGLDILKRLQETPDVAVKIFEKEFPDISETDAKLVRLAEDLKARILTTDFNLNKVASIHGVTVLNVNDLANVLKPVVLPGEGMTVYIVKEGKERKQGVAYLDDGTMVVVENGRNFIGKKLEVVVSSILQTSAGRMVFTMLKDESLRNNPPA